MPTWYNPRLHQYAMTSSPLAVVVGLESAQWWWPTSLYLTDWNPSNVNVFNIQERFWSKYEIKLNISRTNGMIDFWSGTYNMSIFLNIGLRSQNINQNSEWTRYQLASNRPFLEKRIEYNILRVWIHLIGKIDLLWMAPKWILYKVLLHCILWRVSCIYYRHEAICHWKYTRLRHLKAISNIGIINTPGRQFYEADDF